MELVFIVEQVLNGLVVSAYYLLIALGLSLIFSLGGVVNLAHGAFYALGAYFAIEVEKRLGFLGAFALSPVLVALLGVALERTMLKRFYRSDPILSLLLTFGLAMVIEQVIRIVWGAAPLPFQIPAFLKGQLFLGDFIYSYYRLAMLGVAATAVVLTWLLFNKTSFGRVVRAGVQNPDMVAVLGISLAPVMTIVVAIGIGLAGLAGVLLAPIAGVHPAMGTEIITAAFVVVVIGGLGSFWGVVLAAMLVGVVRGLAVYYMPPAAEASMYLLMLLVLLLRPRGLLGERIQKFE
ncbi:branched-chain amino acid ABC transporter permease [Azospirillum sp. TSO22-1]|uniref:branched-chain amino acid ABC transporter permease n=1 Tax=Azospirillum sp. TSO22-1 TaxID=716789 RepID=UPI000D605201|nr:branched-chain amino acid ABC transporter permease [Azospirillum sp. TSO22-1]PWC41693.1 ABC transporter permease [Azospirillum sp. TSO22-1]HYH36975.1 branched-chain amino acid ABC transporter permease [Azospirillum sp.]